MSRRQKDESQIKNRQHNAKLFFVTAAILAAIPFMLGKYVEFNSPGAYDSGSYVYSAKHILEGAELGVEEKPSAQLGTLLMNILGVWLCGFNEIGPKTIQTILQAAALLLMFVAMKNLFGKLPAAVGVILTSFYLSAPLIAKFGNVKEQYMICFMVAGVSFFVLYQLKGNWWYAALAGASLIWAPLFKQTGISAIGAVGLFVISQPLLKNKTFKQTGVDILLLSAGAAAALAPLYIWIIAGNIKITLPYNFVWKILASALPVNGQAETLSSYVSKSRDTFGLGKQFPIVMRYYRLLILPIALAAASIITGIIRMFHNRRKIVAKQHTTYDRFVLLFAVWWLLDMAFVWVSPRSYEQYYLPLNASAAMLGGYLIAVYKDKLKSTAYKEKWKMIGLACLVCMLVMSWHIFFGISKSPHSGSNYGQKRRGYLQRIKMASEHKRGAKAPWEIAGEYINSHSISSDKIYVWGWYPGIYVKAQRLSPVPKAFTSEMHVKTPQVLSEIISGLLAGFEKQPPKFIVDSRKRHFPWDRPPLELWPKTSKGFLPANKQIIYGYDAAYSKMLAEKIEPDEALRYKAMQPFREFVMKNYKIVRPFGQHILFQLKTDSVKKRNNHKQQQ